MNKGILSIWLPLSVLLSIVCACGGSCIFISLFSGIALNLGATDEYVFQLVKDYAFLFVFCTVFSSIFIVQANKYGGGKFWNTAHVLFLLFFLSCYMLRFWPQDPRMVPDFTIRAFLWYGGALALSVVANHFGDKYYKDFSNQDLLARLCLSRTFGFALGGLVVVIPLAVVGLSNITFSLKTVFTIAPIVLLLLASAIYSFKVGSVKNAVLVEHNFIIWYPLAWCFLLMPIVLVLEKLISTYYLKIFQISSVHLYSALLGFVVLVSAILLGAFSGQAIRRLKN